MQYTIKKEDTLSAIAQQFGTTAAMIMAANPQIKHQDDIAEGQIIIIPIAATRATPLGQNTHIVQPGESMYLIAKKHSVSLNTLIKANPQKKNPHLLSPGEVLNLPGPATLTVSAAISLKDVLEELKNVYITTHPHVYIIFNFGASGILQRKIEQNNPVDLFISAGESQMDALAKEGLIVNASRKNLLSNEIVLIATPNSTLTGFAGLTDPAITKIVIGNPATVPAGKYAQETLIYLNLWDTIQPKLVLANDVRQVLHYVESGNADAGMVYYSDALQGKNIKIVATAPAGSHEPIIYPMAIIQNSPHLQAAQSFANFLLSDAAAQIFTKYGFIALR